MLHMLPVSLFAVRYSFTSRAKVVYVRTPFYKIQRPRRIPLEKSAVGCVCVSTRPERAIFLADQ